MRALDTPAREDASRCEDHFVLLQGATWADYQRILEIRGDRSAPRVAYAQGMLEIMSPSQDHERIKSLIGRLVEAYCFERGIEFTTVGSWTLERKELDRGVEPDECYVFGSVADAARPDLAIEVVWTSGRLDKLDIYRHLGVREVWYWRAGALSCHVLRDDRYEQTLRSEVLAGLDLALLARFLDRPTTSAAIHAYREALRSAR